MNTKLFTVLGASAVKNSAVIVPAEVSIVAVYVFAGSITISGAFGYCLAMGPPPWFFAADYPAGPKRADRLPPRAPGPDNGSYVTAPGNLPARPLILTGGAVFDDDARTFRRADVVRSGGRIETLNENAAATQGALSLDCSGKFLIPGLIDCHVHITGSGDPTELSTANSTPLPVRAWRAAQYAEQTLMAGFTTVRDLGE